jgi:glycosyltransferase involved in cell wall biosynthesis
MVYWNYRLMQEPLVEKTNVLIVVTGLNIGGLEKVIAHLVRFVDRDRFNVGVCCLKVIGSIGSELVDEGHSVIALEKPSFLKNNYISWLQVLALVRKQNIHVLHSHSADALLDIALCKLVRRKTRTIHTFHFGNYPDRNPGDLRIERIFSRFADQLVAVGDEQKGRVAAALGIRERSIATVWNGVPVSQDQLPSVLGGAYLEPGRLVIGTACTLIEQKGLTHLLDVAHLLKKSGRKVTFVVAGEGHLRRELEEKRARLGLDDDVVFLGWSDNASRTFIPYVDIFFLPSLWEAMSVVVLEAMEAGKPVVVTNVGENSRVIADGIDGLIAEPRDTEGMARALDRLILDPGLRERMGASAREKVRSQFSVGRMVAAYEALYADRAFR